MLHALVAAALLAASPAEPPKESAGAAAAKEVPMAVQVAREFLTPEIWDRTLKGIIAEYGAKLRAFAEQSGVTVDDGLEPEMRKAYDQIIPYSDLVDLQAGLMKKYFDDAELQKLRDFYRSPLGAKLRDRSPELQRDAIAALLDKVDMTQLGGTLASHFHPPKQPKAEGGASDAGEAKADPAKPPAPAAKEKEGEGKSSKK